MQDVPLDDAAIAALSKPVVPVAITDAAGRMVGMFVPGTMSKQEFAHRYLGLPSPEQIRKNYDPDEQTYTTAEVKEMLRSLEARG